MSNYKRKHEIQYSDNYESQYAELTVRGVPVKVIIENDGYVGFDYLLEEYGYLDYTMTETDWYFNYTEADEIDEAHENGDIDDDEHMKCHAGGYHIISGLYTAIYVDVWESARDFIETCNPALTFEQAVKQVMRDCQRIEDFLCDRWHYVTVTAQIDRDGLRDTYTDSCSGYNSTDFDSNEPHYAKCGDGVIEEMADIVVMDYERKGNYRQLTISVAS